ncbi:MAG: DUF4097 family beta strand repeat-containing protein [Candidatus Cyclobacteriaceae bacterium M2_1C_046]
MERVKIIFLMLLFIASGAMAQQNEELRIPLSSPDKRGKLKVDIKKGDITVLGSSRSDILVKYSSTETAEKITEERGGLKKIAGSAMNLEIIENNNNVKIESGSWDKGADITVEIPAGFDINVSTYNEGDVLVKNVNGEIIISNYNGEIVAESVAGSVVATTYNGDIKVNFLKVTPDTPMAFSTYNGNVDLTFPSDVKYSFKMKTARGDIYSDFDMDITPSGPVKKEDKRSGTYKVYVDEWVNGKINGGGPEVMIKNYNGDIFIRKGK